MTRIFPTAAAIAFLAAHAHAAPADYRDRLPAWIADMQRLEVREDQGNLIAFYGEAIGRATVTVMPAPVSAPGESGFDGSLVSGRTVAAQRVLLRALDKNFEAGTTALGDRYDTSMPRFEPVTMNDDAGKVLVEMSCASILRRKSGGGAEPTALLDRLCVVTKGPDVILQRITTPLAAGDAERVSNDQLSFLGKMAEQLTGTE